MLDNCTIDSIYKKRCHNMTYFFRTTKYFSKDKAFSEGINAIVKNSEMNYSFFKNLAWFFFKHIIIAVEISRFRKEIFYMLFNKNATTFTDYQFKRIINNASNWWLDSSYAKIHLFTDYCNELFNDYNICGDICQNSDYQQDDYYHQIEYANRIMKDIEIEYFNLYKKENAIKLERIKKAMEKPSSEQIEQQAILSAKLYVESFENGELLVNDEVKHNV